MNNRFEQFERITREKEGFIKEMGMELLALEEGYCKGRIVLKEKHTNPMGSAHGGLVFALADTIGGMAAMSYGDNVVTLNASVCFLNPAIDTEYIAERIKELRVQKGYNMRQMATALNLPYTTYVNYEKGEREPNSETIVLMSKYFGVTSDYILGRDDANEKRSAPESSETDPVEEAVKQLTNKLMQLDDARLLELDDYLSYLEWKMQKERQKK